MEKHGFVVLTETGAIREAYLEFMKLLKAFFGGESDWKESCKGGVYFNERGIPMVRINGRSHWKGCFLTPPGFAFFFSSSIDKELP